MSESYLFRISFGDLVLGTVVVFFGYPKTADIRIVDKNPVLARLQELGFVGFMREGSKGKGVRGNPIIIWKD